MLADGTSYSRIEASVFVITLHRHDGFINRSYRCPT
jgi:hypothetical protein